jgi:hypothetical protein
LEEKQKMVQTRASNKEIHENMQREIFGLKEKNKELANIIEGAKQKNEQKL